MVDVEESVENIGDAVGLRVSYLAPDTEQRFDPQAVLDLIGAALLAASLKALFAGLTKPIEAASQKYTSFTLNWTRDWLSAHLGSAFKKKATGDDRDEAIQAVEVDLRKVLDSLPDASISVNDMVSASRDGIMEFLTAKGIPIEQSERISDVVRDQVLALLSEKAHQST
ncbi:hypothetical protein [Streptomyces echinatus]|uniref:hypothetical protein n=1 Tax=Streptomyces echinatus TaxID=67293 RepID=UPI0037907AF9